MKNKGRLARRIIAVIVCMTLVLAALPTGVFSAFAQTEKGKLKVTSISDIHYFADSEKGTGDTKNGFSEAYNEWNDKGSRQHNEVDALLTAALDKAAEEKSDYVFLPGDLTLNGELAGHKALAAKLEAFEKESGIQVIVVNGNHDVNNYNGVTFKNGVKESGEVTSPEAFREIYKNLGRDLVTDEKEDVFTPTTGQAGQLSYAISLKGGYRLIVMDTNKYSSDVTAKGDDVQETAGSITPELMQWVLKQCEKAKKNGETIIGMGHHNFAPHMTIEPELFFAFVLDDWMECAETLADAGMHFTFSGHLHTPDIASHVSDNGETLYDIETTSLSGFPNKFRTVTFDNTQDGKIICDAKSHDIDEDGPIVVNFPNGTSKTYAQPYKDSFSFFKTYGPGDLHNFAMTMIDNALSGIFEDIQEAGGLYAYLEASGIDLEKIIIDALGTNGFEVGSVEIFTVSSNIMSFIKDLCAQVDEAYINNPDHVMEVIDGVVTKALNYQVSDYKCTKFYEAMGMESKNEKGTFEDAAYTVLYTLYNANEDISDDKFMNDVLDYFENRDGAKELINFLIDTLLNDVVEGEILSTLQFNPGKLFPAGSVTSPIGVVTDIIMQIIFRGNPSYENVIYSVLNLLPEKYSSLRNILNTVVMDEYMTQSQYDSIGYTVGRMLRSLVEDTNPAEKSDLDVTLVYDGPVEPEVTQDNMRLPSNIGTTFTGDASTERSINWYTKYSLKNSDIQIAEYSENPTFTDKLPKGVKVSTASELVKREYPGVDLGIIGFISYGINVNRHTATITGLKPGTKYCYRVGDAKYGWWSGTGIIETADNSDSFTFFHVSDEQSQNAVQYGTWGKVVDTALRMFPEGKFFASAGDQVDYTKHFKQWQWFFNASENIKSTAIMPAAGNHEKSGYMLDQNFVLPKTVDQDRESGVFYSYDYNNAHFIVLNTNNLSEDKALSDDQLAWLKADAQASDAQWKIVVLHKALYSNGSHYDDKDVKAMRKQLCGLMPDLGIDIVLQGHDHVYLRTDVMDNNKVVKAEEQKITFGGREYTAKLNPEGTVYVISACAGVKDYQTKDVKDTDKLFPRAEAIYDADNAVFSAITIDGSKLYFDAYMLDDEAKDGATRIDSFALSKAEKEAPENPEKPEKPEKPGLPDLPELPEIPGLPHWPGKPEKPEEPSDPSNPSEPLDPSDPASPIVPSTKPDTNKPDSDSKVPNTGAAAPVMLIAFAGAAFVIGCSAKRKKED